MSLTTVLNAHHDLLYNALPVSELNEATGETTLICPQIVEGNGYSTTVYLMNPSAAEECAGNIAFYDHDGNPLAIDFGSGPRKRLISCCRGTG